MMPISRIPGPPRKLALLKHACLSAAVLLPALLPLHGHSQDSLSGPISGSISDPVYTESQITGPSSSLAPGDRNLSTPSIRTGISDPLGSLLEAGSMSAYLPGGGMALGYAESFVVAQPLNNPAAALGANAYRNNQALMSGTVSTGSLTARARGAGGVVSASSGSRLSQGSSFSGDTMRLQFAAGGSVAGRQQAGSSGFLDPNAIAAMMNSSPNSLAGIQSGGPPGAAGSSASVSGSGLGSSPSGGMGDSLGTSYGGSSYGAGSGAVGGMNSSAMMTGMQSGAASMQNFPILSFASPSATGFEDSTMGTAAQAEDPGTTGPFPSRADLATGEGSPFQEMSSQTSSFLHPSLRGADSSAPAAPTTISIEELTRKARMKAIINNSGTPLPTPFEQHAMQRAVLAQQRRARGRRPSSIPSIPSIVATP